MERKIEKLSESAYFVVDMFSMCQSVLPYDPITFEQSIVATVTYGEPPTMSPLSPEPAPQPGEERVHAAPPAIDEYRDMLERVEDAEDLKTLQQMRKRPLRFKKLDDFLKEHSPGV